MSSDPLQTRRRLALALIAASSVALLQIPLCNYLGYEYSMAIAVLLPWIIGPLVISIERRSQRLPSYASTVSRALRAALFVTIIPLLLGALNGLVVRNCSLPEGVLFFLLIPGVTAVLSSVLGIFCAATFRRPLPWYVLLVTVTFSYGLYLGYATVQIYSYNLMYGYFPGFSYDEILRIRPALVTFRMVSLVAAGFIAVVGEYCWLQRWRERSGERVQLCAESRLWRRFPVAVFLAVVLLLSWWFRDRLGFETSDAYLRSVLDGEIRTQHFRIHYAKNSFTPAELSAIANEHEFRFSQLARALRVQDQRPISSYIYPDPEAQYRLIGTKNTNISKPWRREIHLSRSSWDQTLKHELAHAMAGEFGMPVIHAHYNIGLVEGLAMAVDGEFGNRTLHEYASAVLSFALVQHPERLVRPVGFAFQASSVSYVLMGSFCEYLIDRYGISSFKNLYGGRTPERVYGRSYDDLIAEWEEYLAEYQTPDEWRDHVEYYFRRPSIFAKLCARKTANLNEEGFDALDRKDPARAKEFFRRSYNLSRNSEAYAGLMRAAFAASQFDSVVRLYEAQDSVLLRSTQPLAIFYGDALWMTGRDSSAITVYRRLADLDLSDRLDEAAELRLAALRSPQISTVLRSVVIGTSSDSARLRMLDSSGRLSADPLVRYVRGKILLRLKRYAEAVDAFAGEDLPDAYPSLAEYAERSTAEGDFRLRRYQAAVAHFWNSLNMNDSPAEEHRVDDWIDRCLWYERYAHGE